MALQGVNYALLADHRSGQQRGKADDVRVEFLGFQREIVEENNDAEIENLEAARSKHSSCGLHRFANGDQVGKKHFALLELLADGVQSQNKAAINGFEWVDAFGEGALAECSGAIGIALKDRLLQRFGKLIGHDDCLARVLAKRNRALLDGLRVVLMEH